jgi:phosphatidate cytidylyltransferase
MLKQRMVSGVLLAGMVVVVANFLPSPACWLLILAISALAQYEFYTMMDKANLPVFRFLGMAGGAAVVSATYWTIGPRPEQLAAGYCWENMALMLVALAVFVRQFPQRNNDKPIVTIACTLLGIWYVAFLMNYFTRLGFAWRDGGLLHTVGPTGRMMVLYLVAVVKISDVGAYFTGRFLGRHKLYPRLSPKKTWEGLAGGVASSLLMSLLFYHFAGGRLGVLTLGCYDALILGLLLPVVGVLGDLFESLLKRSSGVKDSGSLIPGMGGVLDVLDSLLFGAPVLYAYAVLFMKG